ncbi:MAG: hypothetical protein DCC67_12560 [Planctomycetota bacterium]|nr:MAG: hypothetical protein DCC67_12560 [Planctomycetota bacterium]
MYSARLPWLLLGTVLLAAGAAERLCAEPRGLFAAGVPTLGGRLVWADEVWLHDWRIQRHSITGHYRLLDPSNRRQTFGSFDTCLAKLNEIKVDQKLPPLPKDVVIVLHGLGAGRSFMKGLSQYLEEHGRLNAVNVGYPSTMEDIDAYAASLDNLVRHLEGVESISFVAHSMGNIVIRRYLFNLERLDPAMRPPVSFKRMVMIAPPNHGAELADRFADSQLVELAAGKPLEQLAPSRGWPELEKQLATPQFEFGVIAGGRGDTVGYFQGIPGDDDGLLSIETMRLDGAADFIQTKGIHQLMPQYKEVRAATLSFLLHGYFTSAQERQPIGAATR